MKFIAALPLLLLANGGGIMNVSAFSISAKMTPHQSSTSTVMMMTGQNQNLKSFKLSPLYSAAPSDVESYPSEEEEIPREEESTSFIVVPNRATLAAREELLRATLDLTDDSPTGIFLTVPSQVQEFSKAVARLEAIGPSTNDESEAMSIGDWTLLATCKRTGLPSLDTAGSSQKNVDEDDKADADDKKKKTLFGGLPKFGTFPIPPKAEVTTKLQKSITVTQRIRSISEASQSTNTIDRIDHVISFDNEQETIIPSILNPFQINKSKIALVHNAKVETFVPFITKLNLSSVILNIAGDAGSALKLDPEGADVFGLNIPQINDLMNGGSFETTYVDGDVRVSRGKTGFLEETRIFVKGGFDLDSAVASMATTAAVDAQEDTTTSTDDEDEDTITTTTEKQLKKVADAFGNVVTAVEKTAEDVQSAQKDALSTIQKDIEEASKTVQEVLEEDLKDVEKAIGSVKSAVINNPEVEDAVDNVVEAVGDLGKDVREVVEGAVGDMKVKVDDDSKKIQEAVEDVRDAVGSVDGKKEKQSDESDSEKEDEVTMEKSDSTDESEDESEPEETTDDTAVTDKKDKKE